MRAYFKCQNHVFREKHCDDDGYMRKTIPDIYSGGAFSNHINPSTTNCTQRLDQTCTSCSEVKRPHSSPPQKNKLDIGSTLVHFNQITFDEIFITQSLFVCLSLCLFACLLWLFYTSYEHTHILTRFVCFDTFHVHFGWLVCVYVLVPIGSLNALIMGDQWLSPLLTR